ncbi:hypothetical protein AVEN_99595-1 [Araneus ventricosus]|uniref:Uncharacterized protein n=1 Tax=Araneus ventricosus TaxID=182803 RepID=A0A4Y2ETZ0_ARAVE|nr:hypothetical protein AVEN_99595-1 [Araneus ventricosus]
MTSEPVLFLQTTELHQKGDVALLNENPRLSHGRFSAPLPKDSGFMTRFHERTYVYTSRVQIKSLGSQRIFLGKFLIGSLTIIMVLMTRLPENFCRSCERDN